jgi:hypothetical protein
VTGAPAWFWAALAGVSMVGAAVGAAIGLGVVTVIEKTRQRGERIDWEGQD